MKQHQGSSKGNTPGTQKKKDMDFIMGETEGCLQSCWADDVLPAHMEHEQFWQSTPRQVYTHRAHCREKQRVVRAMGRTELF